MDEIAVPGILAYKAGDCFANMVSLVNEIPSGKEFSTSTLESMLQQYVTLNFLLQKHTENSAGTKFSFERSSIRFPSARRMPVSRSLACRLPAHVFDEAHMLILTRGSAGLACEPNLLLSRNFLA